MPPRPQPRASAATSSSDRQTRQTTRTGHPATSQQAAADRSPPTVVPPPHPTSGPPTTGSPSASGESDNDEQDEDTVSQLGEARELIQHSAEHIDTAEDPLVLEDLSPESAETHTENQRLIELATRILRRHQNQPTNRAVPVPPKEEKPSRVDKGEMGTYSRKAPMVSYRTTTLSISEIPKVKKLKGEAGYEAWKHDVQFALHTLDLFGFLDGSRQRPTNPEEAEAYDAIDRKLLGWLYSSACEEQPQRHIRESRTSRALWLKLDEVYNQRGIMVDIVAFNNWCNLTPDDCSNIEEFTTKFIKLFDRCQELGFDIGHKQGIMRYIHLVEPEYEIWAATKCAQYRSSNTITDTLYTLTQQCLDEAKKRPKSAAFATAHQTRPPKGATPEPNQALNQPSKGSKNCYHCGNYNHKKAECWLFNPGLRPADWIPRNKRLAYENLTPEQQIGAITQKLISNATLMRPEAATGPMAATAVLSDTKNYAVGLAFSTSKVEKDVAKQWFIDSACDEHYSNYAREHWHQYKKLQTPREITTAAGRAKAIGKGSIILTHILQNGTTLPFEYHDVYHCPSFPYSLISTNKLKHAQKLAYFDGKTDTLRDLKTGAELGHAPGTSGINTLRMLPPTPPALETTTSGVYPTLATALRSHSRSHPHQEKKPRVRLSPHEAHCRLRHLNYNDVITAIEKSDGLLLTGKKREFCETCAIANAKRRPSRKPQTRTKKPDERLHIDVQSLSTQTPTRPQLNQTRELGLKAIHSDMAGPIQDIQ